VALSRSRGIIAVVSDRRRLLPHRPSAEQARAVVEQARAAAAAGVDLFHIRERDLPAADLSRLAREVLAAISGTPTRVLVNDRLDVALATAAHGVHLPAAGLAPSDARRLAPAGFLVGRSIHGAELAGNGADFAIFGTVFPSLSKAPDHLASGVESLSSVSRASHVPVLAIGGIMNATVESVAPFCHGVAAIGWFATTDAEELFESVRHARRAFDTIAPLI
jgi:thiamine-phosphate diphosphorylase